jgi:CMP/dCMP kinase
MGESVLRPQNSCSKTRKRVYNTNVRLMCGAEHDNADVAGRIHALDPGAAYGACAMAAFCFLLNPGRCVMAVVTISRQYGSGGDEVAARVCEILGYRYFDKRLIMEVISQENLTPDALVDYHEDDYKMRSFLDRLLGWRSPKAVKPESRGQVTTRERAEDVRALDEHMLMWLVHAAMQRAYQQGDVVIMGRGGQAILHDKPGVLHVRIEAPLEFRIRHLADREGISLAAAKEAVTRHDNAAADYLKRFYGVNWSDPVLYHLTINGGRWDVEGAAQLIVSAAGCLPVLGTVE